MDNPTKLALLFWGAVGTSIVVFTPVGRSIQSQFITPKANYASNQEAMDACLDFAERHIKADLKRPDPLTSDEWIKDLKSNPDESIVRSTYKNTDGESMILDVWCSRKVGERLFGLIKWNYVVPMINWVEKPDKECREKEYGICLHKHHFDEMIFGYIDEERTQFSFSHFIYPYKK